LAIGMNPGPTDTPSDRCQRCLQPISARVRRCPHCGQAQVGTARKVGIYIGVFGLFLAALLVGLGLYLQRDTPEPDQPANDDAPAQTAPPAKEPPLNR
jgi:hypothetical protein